MKPNSAIKDFSLVMLYKGVRFQLFGRNFHVSNFYVLACSTRTKGRMDKWMLQADSVHQIGLNPILHALLIVVESGGRGLQPL
jgi:hypothetical protein